MSFSDAPDPDDVPEVDPKELERAQELSSKLEAEASKIGLHAQRIDLGRTTDGEHLVLLGHFLVGEMAWSDQVQDPQGTALIEDVEDEIVDDKVREMRERARRLRDTGELE